MSNSKKTDNQVSEASAVELEETDLEQVEGGYLKIGDIAGESLKRPNLDTNKLLVDGDFGPATKNVKDYLKI